jgi:uncharacterized protein YPO0396
MEKTPLFDSAPDLQQGGFRLYRFEVLNWGTFDRCAWVLEPRGHNSLLTGGNGSGKSTLVDALTTLLVPPQRITYNKAAGADGRERTLLSYVRGYFKTARDDAQFAARPVGLRGSESYSVLLGHFRNEGLAQDVSLAQVFWTKAERDQLDRFYVVAGSPLTIARDLSGFGQDMAHLKKRLKESGALLFESFVQYAAEFHRRMDIQSEQAMDLFYQTVSMKSVGNLTDFVREHMLKASDLEERLGPLRRNFENLNQAHTAVVTAKDQMARLDPLVTDGDQCRKAETVAAEMARCRDALRAWFSAQKGILLEERRIKLGTELDKLNDRLTVHEEAVADLRRSRSETEKSIFENGGNRLETIAREIDELEREKVLRERRNREYLSHAGAFGFPKASDLGTFHGNRQRAERRRVELEAERDLGELRKVDVQIRRRAQADERERVARELAFLQGRATNIPLDQLQLRQRLCEVLSLEEAGLPFAGELFQVKLEAAPWEGALERVLRDFGLSLLVPEDLYPRIFRYVNETHLENRLVYFHVREDARSPRHRDHPHFLIHKVVIKEGTSFRLWLEQELAHRFDYLCAETPDEFEREAKTITREGQIKTSGRRHEKDDRFPLGDRSGYVLGWSNQAKVLVFEAQRDRLEENEKKDAEEQVLVERRMKELSRDHESAGHLLQIKEFSEMDWRSTVGRIADREEERRQITESSDILKTLQARFFEIEQHLREEEAALTKRRKEQAVLEERRRVAVEEQKAAEIRRMELPEEDRETLFPQLEGMRAHALGDRKLFVETCDTAEQDMRRWIQKRVDDERDKSKKWRDGTIRRMQEFKVVYPLETQEVDARWEALDEFRFLLNHRREEDFPRHEAQFKKLLNEGTITDMALLQSQLDQERQSLLDKIALINGSLWDIDYDTGTFIEIVSEKTSDSETREFQQDIRACLGRALGESEGDIYNERKFLQVKAIVDRFNGRPNSSEIDQKWTRKVADVRHWFEFSINERWRETNEVKEFISDTSGKSGGQKEKLAYTILASALIYQFGLGWGENRSTSFRFAMVDEAFGRGSDESARYALDLFKKLNLQLLVVTPLQKTQVIEEYVRAVHFVHNEDGKNSKVLNLTIETFQKERARRTAIPVSLDRT